MKPGRLRSSWETTPPVKRRRSDDACSRGDRPVDDILWTDETYRSIYHEAGLEVERVERRWVPATRGFHGSAR
jgi:hypothetical protein